MFRSNQESDRTSQAPVGAERSATDGSSPSGLSAVPSTTSEKSKQPTYTTVGSIYNPSAAAPLQPPTRRPRARRYPPTIQSPPREPLLGLPNALLSALPIKDRPRSEPPATVQGVPEYSPLQQNYDRAVSPVTEHERPVLENIGMSVPCIRSGNLPPPSGLGLAVGDGGKQATRSAGDGDSVASEDTLASSRITVKGLTNLASYPNPMQKAAQNKLAKARAANFAINRAITPSSLTVVSEFGKERVIGTVSTAIGTPQPLTAGPPGQRLYRPSTYDTSFQSANKDTESTSTQQLSGREAFKSDATLPDLYISANSQAQQFFLGELSGPASSADHFASTPKMLYSREKASVSQAYADQTIPGDYSRTTAAISSTDRGNEGKEKEPLRDTTHSANMRRSFPGEPLANCTGEYNTMAEKWNSNEPFMQQTFPQKSRATSAERRAKMDKKFYAGTEGLVKDINLVVREHDNRCLKNKIGVIGEGRERFRTAFADRTGDIVKIHLPFMSVEEASGVEDHLHAEPLLNMAFATLLKYKENSFACGPTSTGVPSRFVTPDPAWVDDSTEGNNSFFDTPKVDQPKKKKIIKKTRRGY